MALLILRTAVPSSAGGVVAIDEMARGPSLMNVNGESRRWPDRFLVRSDSVVIWPLRVVPDLAGLENKRRIAQLDSRLGTTSHSAARQRVPRT
jgi:hypothetical protein